MAAAFRPDYNLGYQPPGKNTTALLHQHKIDFLSMANCYFAKLCLANCYFAHDSSGFPVLLLFFDAQSPSRGERGEL
jgi:hypothetical protein